MSVHILKSHNKTVLLYHLVFPVKYRREVFSKEVESILVETCIGISERFEINFLEIGNDEDHVHFLIQGVPKIPVSRIVQIIKRVLQPERFFLEIKRLKKCFGEETCGQVDSMQIQLDNMAVKK